MSVFATGEKVWPKRSAVADKGVSAVVAFHLSRSPAGAGVGVSVRVANWPGTVPTYS